MSPSSQLLAQLQQNPFVLAPMAGITDCAFRSFMKQLQASVVVTELVSATGLEYSSQKTKDLMKFNPDQHPIGIQLFGDDPEIVARAAQQAQQMGCDFVDLNFGCPVPKVVKKGAGSAILKDLVALQKMVSTVKGAIGIPLTIKIRTGWDAQTRNADEVCNIAFNEGVTWVAIHGRTRAQGYNGHADWEYIAQIKSKAKLPILGNGDIQTAEQAVARLRESACDGILIGRGALKNPYIFMESLALLRGDSQQNLRRDFHMLFLSLHNALRDSSDDRVMQIQLKKFASWFSTGYPGAAQFRKMIFQSQSISEIMNKAAEYFQGLSKGDQSDTSREAFLMGGHG